MADRLAGLGGSWTFILSFVAVLIVWMLLNVKGWLAQPFHRYLFSRMDLPLSCFAALQAPIVMMSQRRQETKDQCARAKSCSHVAISAESRASCGAAARRPIAIPILWYGDCPHSARAPETVKVADGSFLPSACVLNPALTSTNPIRVAGRMVERLVA